MTETAAQRPTWAEINLGNLSFNFRSVKQFIGGDIGYMAVVKADAYGHGAVECSKRLEADGVDWLGVASPEEGVELRKAGIRLPILCLGSFWDGQESLVLNNDLTAVVYLIEEARLLDRAAKDARITANIHLKVDTGMGRIGVRFDAIAEFADKLKNFTNLNLQGIMTHFAAADDLRENAFTNEQIKRFNDATSIILNKRFTPIYFDLANSPGAIAHPDSRGNMVRLGGVLYGLGGDVLPQETDKPELKPVMSLYSKIVHLKQIPSGTTLGYGRTFVTRRDSLIATIPIGYKDGYSRRLSNRCRAIVNGSFSPVAGIVSMDWTLLDVTDVPNAKVGDIVTLMGTQNELSIKAEDVASALDTISYEITCGIDRRVYKRFISA